MACVGTAAEGPWTPIRNMPTARMYVSASVVNGKIYAIGGGPRAQSSVAAVEEYDPATKLWTTRSPMKTPRFGLTTSVVNGKIYAIGGAQGGPPGLRTVEEYDPVTDTWTTKSSMPTARFSLSSSVVNGKIYVIGGGVPTGSRAVEEYNPATDKWTRKASIQVGSYGISTSAVNGKVYAFGGTVAFPTVTPRVEEYDPVTDTWTRKADMPTARSYPATAVLDGKIYVMGGAANHPDNPPVPTVEVYDPESDTWTTIDDMPIARTVFSTSALDGKIYVIGGSTAGFPWSPALAMVEEYDPHPLVVDFNGDRRVDSADMCLMVDFWHTDEPFYDIAPHPFGDGIVDAQDLILLAEHLFEDYRLVAHVTLDETEGNIAYDIAGINDGLLNGEPLWQPTEGMVDGALQLDGINDYVTTAFVLNPTEGSFSVFAWIKGGVPGQVIISQADITFGRVNDPGSAWLGVDPSNDKLMSKLMDKFPPLESESEITDGQWHHVGLVYDCDQLHRYLYVDGVEVAKDTDVVGGVDSTGGLYIGAGKNLDPSSFFSGLIDDVRIYNAVLTTKQIEGLAQ